MEKPVKVKAKVSMSGSLLNGTEIHFVPGQVLLIPPEDAKRWLGFHVELAGPDEALTVETAAFGSVDYSFLEGDDPRLLQRLRGVRPS